MLTLKEIMEPLAAYKKLSGFEVELIPFKETHKAPFIQILNDRKIWEQGFGDGLDAMPKTEQGYIHFIDTVLIPKGYLFSIFHKNNMVGSIGLSKVEIEDEKCEIGRLVIASTAWGNGINTKANLLLIDNLFDNGFSRVQFEIDTRNHRSFRSIAGFGAVLEGVRRHSSKDASGIWRDFSTLSILKDEWEAAIRNKVLEKII